MWWKIVGAVVLVWLGLGLIMTVAKGAFWLLLVGLAMIGAANVFRRVTAGSGSVAPEHRTPDRI